MPQGPETRSQTEKGDLEDSVIIDMGSEEVEKSPEQLPEQGDDDSDDPIWIQLMKRPFFRKANDKQQKDMYFQELARVERAKEREFELKKLEIESRSQGGHSQLTVEGGHSGRLTLPDWEVKSRADTYLSVCEKLFTARGIPKERWVGYLVPKFPDKARNIYNRLSAEKANNYDTLKQEILDQYAISPLVYRRNFFTWSKKPQQTYADFIQVLTEQLDLWVNNSVKEEEDPDYRELLLRYRLDSVLPEELNLFLTDKQTDSVDSCVEFADNYVVNRQIFTKTNKGGSPVTRGFSGTNPKGGGPEFHRSGQANGTPGTHSNHNNSVNPSHRGGSASQGNPNYRSRYCDFCQRSGHLQSECYFDPNSPKYKTPKEDRNSGLQANAPSFVPKQEPTAQPSGLATGLGITSTCCREPLHPLYWEYAGSASILGGSPSVTYLRDTGSTLSLVSKECLSKGTPDYTGERVTVRGINQLTGTYPLARIEINSDLYKGKLTAAVVNHSPLPGVNLILGNDLFAKSRHLDMPCGIMTRAQRKRDPVNLDLNSDMLWKTTRDSDLGVPVPNEQITEESNDEQINDCDQENLANQGGETDLGSESVTNCPTLDLNTAELKAAQVDDPSLTPLWELAERQDENNEGYYVSSKGGLLMYKDKPKKGKLVQDWKINEQIVVPKPLRQQLLDWAHDNLVSGHVGDKRTLQRLKRLFTWPGIRRDVTLHCRSCGPCQRNGRGTKSQVAPLKSLPIVGKPFELISADFVGPLKTTQTGNSYILNVLDHATRYLESFPLSQATAIHTKAAFVELFSRHGVPKQLLTDRGSTFISHMFEGFLKEMGVQHLITSSYRHESNGALERVNATLKTMIKTATENSDMEWDAVLPWLLYAYRSAIHSSTGYSPFFLMYGREPAGPLDLVYSKWIGEENSGEVSVDEYVRQLCETIGVALEEAKDNQVEQADIRADLYNQRHKVKQISFRPGDPVLIHLPVGGKPLVGKWQGPYPIHERVGKQTYIVRTPDKRLKKRQLHVNSLRPWTCKPGQVPQSVGAGMVLGQTIGDIMSNPGPPTEMEQKYDPSNYHLKNCLPTGSLPDMKHLTKSQQTELMTLCEEYPDLFGGKLGRFRGVTHDIDVGDHPPIKMHFYRASPEKLDIMKQEIADMLKLGVIRPSKSEWASPLILVKKQNGEWRPCVDYRKLNSISKGENYPLPRLDDLIDKVGGAKLLTTLDLSKGYWQIELTPRAREVSAFTTPFGQFEFLTMPFGLKMAPMTFQRAMNGVLEGLEEHSSAYLDDLAVRSTSWQQHLVHLHQLFKCLSDHGITLNAKKCVIGGGSVKYLGYQVGSGQVAPVEAKVQAIKTIPPPKTKKELRSFLGTLSFYRRFVPYFAEIASPLTDRLKGSRKSELAISWDNTCQEAFTKLKESLTCKPVLKAPAFDQKFEIYTDASDYGIAAVLTQLEEDTPKPVSFYSRKLLPREKNYSTIEKELLAIMASLDTFRVYVGFGPVTIHSDHKPLVWLRQCTSANQRVLRWALMLAEYDIDVQHIKGTDNCLADLLSRQIA
jgi:transposase InsO family protein